MRIRTLCLLLVLGLLVTGSAWGQGTTTGKLTGRVVDEQGAALPGVTVTASSPAAQGDRVTESRENGSYVFQSLPPGDYQVSYELEGFETRTMNTKVSVAQISTLDVTLGLSAVVEEIVVTGDLSSISETTAAQSTYEQSMIEELPTGRTVRDITTLAPGVQEAGVPLRDRGFAISIAGSQTYENLFMVNGVTINENLRGQALDLYIEDALEETTASISGVSAEYGRFSGGVINAITKSGGNEFSGSLRVNLDNQDWESPTPLTANQTDQINKTYEATLGGRIIKDKLWFFLAARDLSRSETKSLPLTTIPVPTTNTQERQEAKLTLTPHPSHSVVGSYLNRDETATNDDFSAIDTSTLNDRSDPQDLISGNYTGIMTPNFFLEAQYSKRDLTLGVGAGGKTTERLGGTWIVDLTNFTFIGSPVFCAVCLDEQRNNKNAFLKGSYFLTSNSAGTHDLVAGFDTFSDIVIVENHQSGSDFSVWSFQPFIVRGTEVFPQFTANGPNRLRWDPVLDPTQGSDFKQEAVYVNDRWQMNDHWSFNLGVRYDKNDAVDAGGGKVSDDSKVSPRLGVTYDLHGDGDWVINGSYGTYVQPIHNSGNTAAGAASAGELANFQWQYTGPPINPDRNAPTDQLLDADEAIALIFDWFASIGDINNTSNLINVSIPGFGTQIRGGLSSPFAEEVSVGFAKQLGRRGIFRSDFVHREFADFYANRIDTGTGQVDNPDGSSSDLTLIVNENHLLERKYSGLHNQFTYRITDRLNLAGNYTLSHAEGNVEGETRDNGPLASNILSYPELRAFGAHNPTGDLLVDVRHKVRLWAIWDVLSSDHNHLSLSLLESYNSGRPYSAIGAVASRNYVANLSSLGYLFPPPTVNYYFSDRGAFRTDDITRTDFAVNYSFLWHAFGKSLEVFLQPEVVNLFDEQGVERVDNTVLDATTDASLAPFNPFTETPVEGVHWRKGPGFGQPTSEFDYQQPRTFRFSVGFRF